MSTLLTAFHTFVPLQCISSLYLAIVLPLLSLFLSQLRTSALDFFLALGCLLAVIPPSGVWLPFPTSFWMMTETAWHIVHDAAKILHSNFLLTEAWGMSCIILQPAILKTTRLLVLMVFGLWFLWNNKQSPVSWRFSLGPILVFSTWVYTVLLCVQCLNLQVLTGYVVLFLCQMHSWCLAKLEWKSHSVILFSCKSYFWSCRWLWKDRWWYKERSRSA